MSKRKQSARSAGGSPKVSAHHSQEKRPYQAPRLTVYGSLRKLALGVGGVKGDGAFNPKSRA